MTTATAVQCQKCEASALHLITESDMYGEYTKCLQCGEVQADKVLGDWADDHPADGTRVYERNAPTYITLQMCVPGTSWKAKSDIALLEIEYCAVRNYEAKRVRPTAIITRIKGWPEKWLVYAYSRNIPKVKKHFRIKTGYYPSCFEEALQLSLADKTLI